MNNRTERWVKHINNVNIFDRYIHKFTINRLYNIRNDFSQRYLRGSGYEIGAQSSPVQLLKGKADVKYIDYLNRKESSEKYNIPYESCVDVDILCDANRLTPIQSETASFVVSNHVIEHTPDPIGALLEWLRILKPEGILLFSAPNYKANEFDFEKKPYPVQHLIDDFQNNGKADISSVHIDEHVSIVDGIKDKKSQEFKRRKDDLIASNLHTHYHVFDEELLLKMLSYVNTKTPLEIISSISFEYGFEFLLVVRKKKHSKGRIHLRNTTIPALSILFLNILKVIRSRLKNFF